MRNTFLSLATSSSAFGIREAPPQRRIPNPTNAVQDSQATVKDMQTFWMEKFTTSCSGVAPGGFDVRLIQADQRRASRGF